MKVFISLLLFAGLEISMSVIAWEEGSNGFDRYIHENLEARTGIDSLTHRSINSKCTKEAIEEVVEVCVSEGIEAIDPVTRKESALRLSICEFKASGVEYPFDCHILYTSEDYSRCISSLEKIPQYWTTFSGNYRDIGRICYEESLPFQKDHIIGLYSNISRIYNVMYESMVGGQRMSEEAMQDLRSKFDNMLDIVEILVHQQKDHQEEMSRDYEQFNCDIKKALNRTMGEFTAFSGDLEINVEEINSHINRAVTELAELSYAFREEDFVDQVAVIKLKVLKDFEELDEKSNAILYNIVKDLELSTGIITDNLELTIDLSKSLRDNKEIIEGFNSELNGNNDLIQLQSEILRSEFEFSVLSFSKMMDEQMELYLEKSNSMIETQVKDLVEDIYYDLNKTISSLNRVNRQLDFFSNSINNATMFMYQGLKLVTENTFLDSLISIKNSAQNKFEGFTIFSRNLCLRIARFMMVLLVGIFLISKIVLSFLEFPSYFSFNSDNNRNRNSIIHIPSTLHIVGILISIISIVCGIYFAIFVSKFATHLKLHMEGLDDIENN